MRIPVWRSRWVSGSLKPDFRSWHICDLWRRLNKGCLRELSGSVATAPRGPGLVDAVEKGLVKTGEQ